MAIPRGSRPTSSIVNSTRKLDVSSTEMELLRALVTYRRRPLGVSASPYGSVPTPMLANTVGGVELLSMNVTWPLTVSVTYTQCPSGEMARLDGPSRTGISKVLLISRMTPIRRPWKFRSLQDRNFQGLLIGVILDINYGNGVLVRIYDPDKPAVRRDRDRAGTRWSSQNRRILGFDRGASAGQNDRDNQRKGENHQGNLAGSLSIPHASSS